MKPADIMPASGSGEWVTMLRARMMPNVAARIEVGPSEGELRMLIPTQRPAYLVPPLTWIVRPPPFRTVVLDTLGAEVWRLCDGKRTVESVIEEFAAANGLTFHEARVAVTAYLKRLLQKGALAVAV